MEKGCVKQKAFFNIYIWLSFGKVCSLKWNYRQLHTICSIIKMQLYWIYFCLHISVIYAANSIQVPFHLSTYIEPSNIFSPIFHHSSVIIWNVHTVFPISACVYAHKGKRARTQWKRKESSPWCRLQIESIRLDFYK